MKNEKEIKYMSYECEHSFEKEVEKNPKMTLVEYLKTKVKLLLTK